MVIAVLLSSINSFAQIKNAKTDTLKIYGNCGMCKTTIEKVSPQEMPIYYQHCPMYSGKGANWSMKKEPVKNPYYGSQMLSCSSTVETIKQ